ncbi:hypothetical protein [Glutamicibacter sp. AOP5-A2-18]|uniref:hypothetical protein n=1 Tax=Glutamicibacter sp. AOP5-A2-18 TaxID=3457656 RepID=UPI0040334E20
MPALHGEQHYRAKLTDKTVHLIRKTYSPGQIGYAQLAERHGVSQSTISRIITGATWKHLQEKK